MANELGLVWIQIQFLFFFSFKPSPMELVWKHKILPYNHANLNSHSRRSRQRRSLRNLPDFSNQVWTSNKFSSHSKAVLLPGILIQIMFGIGTCLQQESCSLSSILLDWKVFWILEHHKADFHILHPTGARHEQCSPNTIPTHTTGSKDDRGPPLSDPGAGDSRVPVRTDGAIGPTSRRSIDADVEARRHSLVFLLSL
jgi:hypothetical protein